MKRIISLILGMTFVFSASIPNVSAAMVYAKDVLIQMDIVKKGLSQKIYWRKNVIEELTALADLYRQQSFG